MDDRIDEPVDIVSVKPAEAIIELWGWTKMGCQKKSLLSDAISWS